MITGKYKDWVKQANLPPLTNTQHQFAEWLLLNENQINKTGNLEVIFESVRKYLKNK